MPRLLGFPARIFTLASLSLPAMLGSSLWSNQAQACDWQAGVAAVHPPPESTLALNDTIVLSLLEVQIDDVELEVTIDGEVAAVEFVPLVEERNVFLDEDLVAIRFADSALVQDAVVSVAVVSDGMESEKLGTYEVGFIDKTKLVPDDAAASVALEFVPSDDADSCGLPDRYDAVATLEPAPDVGDARRSRFLQLTFYPQGGSAQDAVGRSVVALGDSEEQVYGGFAADEDPAELCAQVSVLDASGNEEIVLEDCSLCETSPEACEANPSGTDTDGGGTDGSGTDGGQSGGETSGSSNDDSGGTDTDTDGASAGAAEGSGGGCTVSGPPPVSWALVLLGMLGTARRRRRR